MACPFLVSQRAREVLSGHRLPPHYFFDVLLGNHRGAATHYLLHCPYLSHEAIDFAASRFRVNMGLPAAPKWEYPDINSFPAYDAFRSHTRKRAEFDSMVMSERFDAQLDFFHCRIGPMYVSERLKKAIEAADLTGLFFPSSTGSWAYAQ